MFLIKLSVQSKEKEIVEFLVELKNILFCEEFNIDNDLTIIKSKKKDGKEMPTSAMIVIK